MVNSLQHFGIRIDTIKYLALVCQVREPPGSGLLLYFYAGGWAFSFTQCLKRLTQLLQPLGPDEIWQNQITIVVEKLLICLG